jgi:hypothetical protein
MNCSRDDLVLLPIPFTDLSSRRVRPAIVIGFGSFPGDLFVVPLTSQLANADFALADWRAGGPERPAESKHNSPPMLVLRSSAACRPRIPLFSTCTLAAG